MANNPAFNRLEKDAQTGYAGFRNDPVGATGPATAGYASQDAMTAQQLQDLYNRPTAGPVDTQRVTMDDVIMKTLGLFAIVVSTAAAGWYIARSNEALGAGLWIGGMVVGLVLGLVIAFKKTLSVPLIVGYSFAEGVFIGAVSYFFEQWYPGIVATAVVATMATFAGMFVAYRVGLIKVSSKFRRIMGMAIIGYGIFMLVNFGVAVFTDTPFGIGGTGMLGIAISVFGVGLAALTLALDFDDIDMAIRTGAPQKYSWLLAHGLIVTLVWLYIEFLRLFARLRSE